MGKARRPETAIDRLREIMQTGSDLYALNRIRIVPRSISPPSKGAASVGGGIGGTGSFLPLSGGNISGPLGLGIQLFFISSTGRIDVDDAAVNILVTGAGTPDDLRFIDKARYDGQMIVYHGTNQQIQNLKNAKTFVITGIVGTGTTNIITVTMASTTGLTNGDLVDVSFTNNFNRQDGVVSNLTSTTFTYDLGATGSATAETTGTVQNGNIFTNDGTDLVLDGTLSTLGVPVVPLIFDSTAPAGGGWRPWEGAGGGGTGISFPLDFPEETDRGTITTNQVINFTGSTRHSVLFTIGTASVTLDLTNPPANKLALSSITIKQDGTGGRTFSFVPTVVNGTVITDAFAALSSGQQISFVVEWERGVFTAYLKTGNIGGSGGASTLGELSDVTITSPVDNNFLAFDNSSSLWINQTASQAGVAQGNLGNLASTAVNAVILPAATATTDFGSELKAWRIIHAREYELHGTTSAPIASTDDQITLLNTSKNFIFNVKTGTKFIWYFTGVSKWDMSATSFTGPNIILSNTLTINDSVSDPASNGQFSRNGNDVKVFTGGGVKNLSNIGAGSPLTTKGDIFTYDTNNQRLAIGTANQILSVDLTETTGLKWITLVDSGANVELSNLSNTAVTEVILPAVTATTDFGSATKAWRIIHAREYELHGTTSAPIASTDNQISLITTSNNWAFNIKTGTTFIWYFTGVSKWGMTSTVLTGDNLILNNILTINDSSLDPLANGQFSRNGSVLGLFASDFELRNTTTGSSPTANFISYRKYAASLNDNLGSIRFDGGTTRTQYARIIAGVGEPTDSGLLSLQVRADNSALTTAVQFKGDDDNTNTYMTVNSRINSSLGFGVENAGAGLFKISPIVGNTKLGIVVQDNVSFVVGAGGTNAVPTVNVFGADNKTQLDTAFGNHKGAVGMGDLTSPGSLYIRQSNGNWSKFTASSIIV